MELTQQQKLEILCAYLPHGVEALVDLGGINPTKCKLAMAGCNHSRGYFESKHFSEWSEKYKLILRHPDDMTEEEYAQLGKIIAPDKPYPFELIGYNYMNNEDTIRLTISQSQQALNYLHSLHIDTFGAIEAGWAVRKETN